VLSINDHCYQTGCCRTVWCLNVILMTPDIWSFSHWWTRIHTVRQNMAQTNEINNSHSSGISLVRCIFVHAVNIMSVILELLATVSHISYFLAVLPIQPPPTHTPWALLNFFTRSSISVPLENDLFSPAFSGKVFCFIVWLNRVSAYPNSVFTIFACGLFNFVNKRFLS
jgi:hypothetical protein